MWFQRMPLEEWFDTFQYRVEYDVGESAVKFLTFEELGINPEKIELRYGHHRGRPDLRETIAGQYTGLAAENIIVTNGASEANFDIVSAVLCPGDHVIVEHPNYPSLYEVPRSLRCEVTLFSLTFENRFRPDLDALKKLVRPDTKLITLTHPNNPTGSMISPDFLESVVAFAESRNILLLFDETYRMLAFEDPLPGAASLSPQVVSISSMSKCYSLPGIRIGWLATRNEKLLEQVLAVREQVSIANNALGEEIAFNVLKKKEAYLKRAQDHVRKNVYRIREWMADQKNLEWIEPEAGVVCFPRIRDGLTEDPEILYRTLAEEHRTFVVPGRCFEMDNRFFRLGYGGTSEDIEGGLKKIQTVLNALS